ncbi:MAG: M20/M25/M40 family metallo-hydrolase, partial [Planctomycetota bacterium]|nr:M20/M25/M40 family metallo-hydrolase [Planctomycetota bacterium]
MNLPEPETLLRQLIDIPSISGEEEAVGQFLQTLLANLGFEVQTQEVSPGRNNLLATRRGHEPRILLCSHIDTVPPYVPFRETKDLIYGRGACDTKGVITSMLHAGKSLLMEGFQDFGYLFLVGEEVDHCGAIEARKLGLSPTACIVGEP